MEIEDCSFPLFVSPAALQRETDHIEGFAPEVSSEIVFLISTVW